MMETVNVKGKLQLFDAKDKPTGELADVIHCRECGAVVFDMPTHVIFHKRTERLEKMALAAPIHDWSVGPQG